MSVTLKRLLFASIHGYLDPSNGAATATRDLLELLAACETDCRAQATWRGGQLAMRSRE